MRLFNRFIEGVFLGLGLGVAYWLFHGIVALATLINNGPFQSGIFQ